MKKIIVGLTGQSGVGKSTVAKIFAKNGFDVVDADAIAREITTTKETAQLLSQHFGNNVMQDDGYLNRRALASIVFSDKQQLQKLNSLLFPIICEKINDRIETSNRKFILLDAPQLFESGSDKICDCIVSVVAPKEVLIERITRRDGISVHDAENRLNSQLPEEFFKNNSTYIITSNSSLENLRKNTINIISQILGNNSMLCDVFDL